MSLNTLPVELLALVLNEPNSYLVLELWKCGNRALNHRLHNGGIRDIVLKADPLSKTTRWPRCLKEFRLESLSVSSKETGVCTTPTLRNELKQLRRGLRSLELAFGGCTRALCGLAFSTIDAADAPSEENYDGLPAKCAKYSDAFDHHLSLWPRLERLVLHDDTNHEIPFNAVSPYLPRSLTHLGLYGGFSFKCYEDAGAYDLASLKDIFPPRLNTLRLLSSSLGHHLIECLPATITDIGSSLSEEATALYLHQPSLLPNLRTADLTQLQDQQGAILAAWCEKFDAWPICFTSTTIRGNLEQFFTGKKENSVPSSLHLHSDHDSSDPMPCVCEAWIALLMPLSITYLDIDIVDWTGTLSQGSAIESWMWPPTLKSMNLNSRTFDSAWLYKLPRALTRLSGSPRYCAKVDLPKFNLPLLLENGVSAINGPDKELWQSIRRELLRKSGTPSEMLAVETYLKDVESGRLFGLPLTLETMSLGDSMASSTSTTMILPPRLTHLDTYRKRGKLNMFELRKSDLELLQEVDGVGHVGATEPPMSALQSAFNLKSYTCDFDATDSLGTLDSLPRQLQTLEFTIFLSGELELIAQQWRQCTYFDLLPPTLTELRMRCNRDVCPKLERIEMLPRSLTVLVTNTSIEGRDFAFLPPGLLYLDAPINSVSLDDLLSLPRHLRGLMHYNTPQRTRNNDLPPEHLNVLLVYCRPYYRIYGVERAVLEHICSVTCHTPTVQKENSLLGQSLTSVLKSAVTSTNYVTNATKAIGKWLGRKIWSDSSMESSNSMKVSGKENELPHGNYEGHAATTAECATNGDMETEKESHEDAELDSWGRVLPHSHQYTDIDPFTPLLINGLPAR